MEIISKEEFAELANFTGEPCISVYVPAHSAGLQVNDRHDVILFKNALQQIKKVLLGKSYDIEKADAILKPALELLDDVEFWNNHSEGLAVFISDQFLKTFKLPVTVKEEIHVNSSFLLTPLLPIMTNKTEFYLLLLSKHDAKLYKGDAYGMQRKDVMGLPNGMDDVLNLEENDQGNGNSNHGHGLESEKEHISQYLKEVDQTLMKEVLSTSHCPLIVAAVEYIAAMYKQVSHYKNIAEESIIGNYEHEDRKVLFQKATEKLEPYFKERVNKALLNYYNNSATDLTSSIPADVIPASHYKQVSELFAVKNEHIWGNFDEVNNQLILHDKEQQGDECLLNKAVIKTIQNGGEVYLIDKEKMPADSKIAAFMRF